jgi:DNA-binding transcriptional ArsR family regulator
MEQDIKVLDDIRLAKVFTSETRVGMVKELATEPKSISQLARALDISPPAALYHVRILEKAGLIRLVREDVVRNNFVEKFYALTSPSFMMIGDTRAKRGPVPAKGEKEEFKWIAKVEGVDEYLAGFGLRVEEGRRADLEAALIAMMGIISRQAKALGKDLFAQLDAGLSREQLEKVEALSATIAAIAAARALDDKEAVDVMHSVKEMLQPL